jgi:hypothetical protein
MTSPSEGQASPAQIRVYEIPHAHVAITGPDEAAVFRKAADWLDTLDGSVVVVATSWQGDISEIPGTTSQPDEPLYQMDLIVDMSLAVSEGRWPRDWFQQRF